MVLCYTNISRHRGGNLGRNFMKHYAVFFTLLLLPSYLIGEKLDNEQTTEQHPDYGHQILDQAGNIMVNWIQLLHDPRNSQHALPLAASMVQGILNIAMLAGKSKQHIEKALMRFIQTKQGQEFLLKWQTVMQQEFRKQTL